MTLDLDKGIHKTFYIQIRSKYKQIQEKKSFTVNQYVTSQIFSIETHVDFEVDFSTKNGHFYFYHSIKRKVYRL